MEESFGGWIKRRRRELALTQQDLARAVHISLSALQKYETGDRRPTRAMAEQLATALALGAAEREQFLRLARGLTPLEPAAPVEEPVVELYPSGLPAPLTGLIGRDDDLARLVPRLLGPARLLTITGPGGVGKTRLSLALAARVAGRFADGPWFVELAALADAQFLADTIGRRLGLREQADQPLIELLLVYLRERELLLVLDNFEHLLAAAPVLARLLAAAPRLRIIVTSRVPLQLYGEYEYPLDPLATAQQGGSISPAAQLFAERAEAANPRFVLTDETMGIVATIVARLDGLPLAIELAAARTRLLAPATLLELLSHERLEVRGEELDRPDRHRTLRTAISWSYALLDPVEQQLLANLAIFEGGCSLTAIKAVVKDHERPLIDGLGRLVSASLVRSLIDEAGESRFVMLETVREFAREQLLLSRLYQQVCEGHGLYYSQLAQKSASELQGHQQAAWLALLDRELPNLRAALRWLIEQRNEQAVQMAGSLNRFWLVRGHLREGLSWLEQALAIAGEATTREAQLVLADALKGSGILSAELGRMAQARSYFERALALWRQADEPAMVARTLNNLGIMTMNEGDFGAAIPLFAEAIALAQTLGDRWSIATTQNNLGLAYVALRQFEQAVAALQACAAYNREAGDESNLIANLINLGLPLLELGAEVEATACYREAISRAYQLNDIDSVASACEGLAYIALSTGFVVRAARLLGAAEHVRSQIAVERMPMFQPTYEKMLERIKAQLTPAAWEEAYAAGKRLSLTELMTQEATAPLIPGPQ